MSLLKQKIIKDLNEAIKNKSELVVSVLRMLHSAIKNKEIEKRTRISKKEKNIKQLEKLSELADQEIIDVISSEIKRRKEAIEHYKSAKRDLLADKELREIEILMRYLPEQLSENDLEKIIDQEIQAIGAKSLKDLSKVISQIMPKIKGRADNSLVVKLIKNKLMTSQ